MRLSLDPVARRLGPPDRAARVGVEHEYRVVAGGVAVDLRGVVGRLVPALPRMDPGDHRAVRLASGCALTADGWELELATPPVPLGPDAGAALVLLVERAHAEIAADLAAALENPVLRGFSTHVNFGVPDRAVVRVARTLARTAAPALAWLADAPAGDGVLVRPRRGRLEICTDFVGPDALPRVVSGLAALVAAARRGVRLGPPGPAAEPARERFGFFLPRQVAGRDSYADPRLAKRARAVLGRAGWRPPAGPTPDAARLADAAVVDLRPRLRGDIVVDAVAATWVATAWRVTGARGVRYVTVPARDHAAFLAALDAGRLDALWARTLG